MFSSQFTVGIVSNARYLITPPSGLAALCSNSFLGTRQMLMHEKPWLIPIFAPARQHHAFFTAEKNYFDSNTIQKRKIYIVAMFSKEGVCSGQ